MARIRLELDFIKINRNRKRWNIYFILATEDPTDPNKTVVSVFPKEPIRMHPQDENRIDFEPEGTGDTNGMFIFERDMPEDDSVRARIWVVQSREKQRDAGKIIAKVANSVEGEKAIDTVLTALSVSNPWIAVGKSILSLGGLIGKFLSESKDTKKGYVSMDESFTPEEVNLGDLDRSNKLTGFGDVGWTWFIEK